MENVKTLLDVTNKIKQIEKRVDQIFAELKKTEYALKFAKTIDDQEMVAIYSLEIQLIKTRIKNLNDEIEVLRDFEIVGINGEVEIKNL